MRRVMLEGIFSPKKINLIVALLFFFVGLVFNQWAIEAIFSPDGMIESKATKLAIVFFDAFSIVLGCLIIYYRKKNFINLRNICVSILVVILSLLAMEGIVRVFNFAKNKIFPNDRFISEYLGWQTTPNLSLHSNRRGYGKIDYSTTRDGFRVFGDVNSSKRKIFVIGDSFTEAFSVSDGFTYYDYLKNNADVEIFAYGAGGYGSLQEYMILEKYLDEIKPDIILWQYCDNDFVNNSHQLESVSSENNHMVRPYYQNGYVEWLYPAVNCGVFCKVIQSSQLLRLLDLSFAIFLPDSTGSIEGHLSESHSLFISAAGVTKDIMCKFRERAGGVPVVAFSVNSDDSFYGKTFQNMSNECGIHYIKKVGDEVNRAKQDGLIVNGTPYDTHWNDVGNRIAGEKILRYLLNKRFISKQ